MLDKIQELVENIEIKVNPKLNKDLYAKEVGILKYHNYSIKVKQTQEEELLNATNTDINE